MNEVTIYNVQDMSTMANHIDGVLVAPVPGYVGRVTASENRKHAFRTGLQVVSEAQRKASSENITAWNRRAK